MHRWSRGKAPLITTTCGLVPSTHTAVYTLPEPTAESAVIRRAMHRKRGERHGKYIRHTIKKNIHRKLNWTELKVVDTNWLILFIPVSRFQLKWSGCKVYDLSFSVVICKPHLSFPDWFHLALSGFERTTTSDEANLKTDISEFPVLLMDIKCSDLKWARPSAIANGKKQGPTFHFLP